MQNWSHIKKIVVVGLGITGLSVIKHLQRLQQSGELSAQADIKVIDTRALPPGKEALPRSVELYCGGWALEWLLDADLIVISPGIALSTPQIKQAKDKGIPIVGDIELFAWAAVGKSVIAITGSNGKSTVTDLTGVLAKAAGVNVAVGGNIGIPALDLLEQDADLYVLELSSFQLETTSSLSLVAAAFLNLSEDHMDRYSGMEDYAQAKRRIFAHAKHIVVNQDDPATFPSSNYLNNGLEDAQLVMFGFNCPQWGVITRQDQQWLAEGNKAIIAVNELGLIGRHNVANALVALALLKTAQIDYHRSLTALKAYTGLAHRCQLVSRHNNIFWVNDSKATNVASTLAALSGLNCQGKLYLLVGGDGKGADFSELAPVLQSLNVQLCCYGKDGDQFMPLHPSAQRFDSLTDAIQSFSSQLISGDMVMLSPACASFDQFNNFMHRGDFFTEIAREFTTTSSKS